MDYNFVLIRTQRGGKYAHKILDSIRWLWKNKYPQHEFFCVDWTINKFLDGGFQSIKNNFRSDRTIIHARCANPRTNWTIKLRELEEMGYKVVNSVDTIELTSNKLACSLHLQGKVNHPKSWEYSRNMNNDDLHNLILDVDNSVRGKEYPRYIIAKPLTSLEQGANVKKIDWDNSAYIPQLKRLLNEVPGNKIVIQEFIPYTALHRVIVIGGKALPYTFIDKPEWHKNGDWKVSCCLNTTTMKILEAPYKEILELAERTQKEVGGIINFIDIFEYLEKVPNQYNPNQIKTSYTNAEINTACSLNIHENLAKLAGRNDWNIHSRIAKQLVKELIG